MVFHAEIKICLVFTFIIINDMRMTLPVEYTIGFSLSRIADITHFFFKENL